MVVSKIAGDLRAISRKSLFHNHQTNGTRENLDKECPADDGERIVEKMRGMMVQRFLERR
jgi:hypothetical protein